MGEWEREHPDTKARVIADFCEHNTREAYAMEATKAAAEKPKDVGFAPAPNWAQFRQGGGSA